MGTATSVSQDGEIYVDQMDTPLGRPGALGSWNNLLSFRILCEMDVEFWPTVMPHASPGSRSPPSGIHCPMALLVVNDPIFFSW